MFPFRPGSRTQKVVASAVLLAGFFLGGESYARFVPEIYDNLGQYRRTGFRLGKGMLHGALGMTHGYDSNALYSGENAQSDYVFRLIPGVDFNWQGAKFSLLSTYRFTFQKQATHNLQDNNAHRAKVEARYDLSRRIRFSVENELDKTSDPADAEIPERVGRFTNRTEVEAIYQTPGQDLVNNLRYTHTYRKYDATLDALSYYNNKVSATSKVNISSTFRFLPKSIASGKIEYGRTDWNQPAATITNNDSHGLTLGVGLTSKFSRKLSASANLYYAAIFFEAGPDASTVAGDVSGTWEPNRRLDANLGYRYRVQVSTFTNYYNSHELFLDASWRFARRFELSLRTRYDFLRFSGPNTTATGENRNDFVIQLINSLSYQLVRWAKLRLDYRLDYRDSNATYPVLGTDTANFNKHGVRFGIDLYY